MSIARSLEKVALVRVFTPYGQLRMAPVAIEMPAPLEYTNVDQQQINLSYNRGPAP